MKIHSLKSKFITVAIAVNMVATSVFSTAVFADEGALPFEEREGFKIENAAAGKSVLESDGWLNDVSDSLDDSIIAYEYINQSSEERNTADKLSDGDLSTYVSFEALRDLQITHNFSGTIEGIEIFYVPKSESIGQTMKITGSKLTQTLDTFVIQGEADKLTSVFVPVNYSTNGDKIRLYSGGLYGYPLDIYEIKIYSSNGGSLDFGAVTDGITDVQYNFHSINADGKMIIDLGAEYELAGIRTFSAENLKLYLCSEYPEGDFSESDLVYSTGSASDDGKYIDCSKGARYLCIKASDVTLKCAEIEVFAYVPAGGEISYSELVDFEASYPSENNGIGVTNIDGHDSVVVAFNEDVFTSYLNVELLDETGMSVPYTGLETFSKEIKLPIFNLESNTKYSLIIKSGLVTKSGKLVNDDFVFEFTTGTLRTSVDLDEIIAGVTPADGATGVTNLESYGFVKITFSEAMQASSFADGIVIKNDAGEILKNVEYAYENNEYKLDLKNFAANTKYTLTLKADKLKAAGIDIKGDDFSTSFTTGYIFPYKSIEGYIITNVALNKNVYSNASDQGALKNINDGNYDDYFTLVHTGGNGMNVIDLGNYYKVIAVQYVASNKFNYNTNTDSHYHTKDTNIYSSREYPNSDFSNLALLHTTKAHLNGEKTMVENTGDEYVRYITTVSRYSISVYAELEAYAYVKENYAPINYEITQSEFIASTSVRNYTNDNKDIYMLISAYDEKGDFIGLKCKKFIAEANTTTPFEARYDLAGVRETLLSANAKKIVIQLLGGFAECRSLTVPLDIAR